MSRASSFPPSAKPAASTSPSTKKRLPPLQSPAAAPLASTTFGTTPLRNPPPLHLQPLPPLPRLSPRLCSTSFRPNHSLQRTPQHRIPNLNSIPKKRQLKLASAPSYKPPPSKLPSRSLPTQIPRWNIPTSPSSNPAPFRTHLPRLHPCLQFLPPRPTAPWRK